MSTPLAGYLQQKGYSFEFFQAARLLEKQFFDSGSNSIKSKLKFQSLNDLAFPPADVMDINFEKNRPSIKLSFMGLLGVSSPLPAYITDPIAMGKEEMAPLKKLLEIFEQRIYELYFAAWKKYRPLTHCRGASRHPIAVSLALLSGQNPDKFLPDSEDAVQKKILATRFQVPGARSAANLVQLIKSVFGFQDVRVREFIKKWIPNPCRIELGSAACQLGKGTLLGEGVSDPAGAILIQINGIAREFYDQNFSGEIAPGSSLKKEIKNLVDDFLRDPINYQIEIKLAEPRNPECKLGNPQTHLGTGTWLGTQSLEPVTLIL